MVLLSLVLTIFTLLGVGKLRLGSDLSELFQPQGRGYDTTYFEPEYDFVVIGAGSSGSVIANRLSENPNWKVLLLEAGQDENVISDIPLTAPVLSVTGYSWRIMAEPQPYSCRGALQQRCRLTRGRAVGGTSVINFLVYSRSNRHDHDDWERMGNHGWSYQHILPYYIKSERLAEGTQAEPGYHGFNGGLDVANPVYESPLIGQFLQAGQEMGYNVVDPNGRSQVGFARVQATSRKGRRCSAAKAFLDPVRGRRNLAITKNAKVVKIHIDPYTKQAYAVTFVKDRVQRTVRASKEIILSAGAISSPQLLMLSGVGPREHLQEFGIPVIQDLRVGYNFQDHLMMTGITFFINESLTLTDRQAQNPALGLQYFLRGVGPYTLPGGAMAYGFVNSKYNNLVDRPDVELVIGIGSLAGDTMGALRNLIGVKEDFWRQVYDGYQDQPSFSIVPVLMAPRSRGRVMLKSANPHKWPKVYTNYLKDEHDVRVLVEGIKMAVQLGESRPFARFNSRFHHVPFPGCEHLPFRSDPYWECCVRLLAGSLGHHSGTCRMGPDSDREAVVDPELRVRGIRGLRVADTSILPTIGSGHTNAIAFVIGEKASDMIKQAWKAS